MERDLWTLQKDNIEIIEKLQREDVPLTSCVKVDNHTNRISKCFDYNFDGTSQFFPFKFSKLLKSLDFNILCIVGASGRGKSTFSKHFGEDESCVWDNTKCVLSNIDDDVDKALAKINAVGLNTVPVWVKPFEVLSVGEKFRATLARKLKNNCVIDEFTSNVDRNVALSCAMSIGKYIRKNNLKKCVFVSCHKDFIDTLCPDYVIDLDTECLYDTRRLLRRRFELSIYEKNNKREVWNLFRQYHYLTSDLNIASRCFVAYLNDEMVACCFVLPHPGMVHNAFRIHRLVVLPDYQGLGIGKRLLEYVCDIYNHAQKTMYIRTSNYKLAMYMKEESNKWLETCRSGTQSPQDGVLWKVIQDRIAYSFKYIGGNCGKYHYDKIDLTPKTINKKEKISLDDKYITILDII